MPEPFPHCELRDIRILAALPNECPMTALCAAFKTLHSIQVAAYAKMARRPIPDHTGLDDLARCEVCYQCIDRLAAHPLVRRLRKGRRA